MIDAQLMYNFNWTLEYIRNMDLDDYIESYCNLKWVRKKEVKM